MRNFFFVLAMCLVPMVAHAAVPTGERLDAALNGPLLREPTRKNLATWTTTIDDAVDADVERKSDSSLQIFTVTNVDTSTDLCIGSVPLLASETCGAALCGTATKWTDAHPAGNGMAATMNCTHGDASMGTIVPFGKAIKVIYSGDRCACAVASGANTDAQIERTTR